MVMIDSVDGDNVLERLLLAELDLNTQATFSEVATLSHGILLLAFLDANPNTLSAADAIAFRLGEDQEEIAESLRGLRRLGLVRRLDVGPTLWGLTDDPEKRDLVRTLVEWQNRWKVRLARLDRVVWGTPCEGQKQDHDGAAHDCREHADCSRCASVLIAAIQTLQAA